MSDKLNRAKALEAEAKAIRRAEKQFWLDVEARRAEIEEFFRIKNLKKDVSLDIYVPSESTEPYL